MLEHRAQRLEDAVAPDRHRLQPRRAPPVERDGQLLDRRDLGQVPLVVLEDEGDRGRVELVRGQVAVHLLEAGHVLLEPVRRRVRDEHHRVRAARHQPPRGRVGRLPGHGHDLEADVEAVEADPAQGQEVEEDRAVLLRVDGDELAAVTALGRGVERLEVGRLPADRRPVVQDLQLDDAVAGFEFHELRFR